MDEPTSNRAHLLTVTAHDPSEWMADDTDVEWGTWSSEQPTEPPTTTPEGSGALPFPEPEDHELAEPFDELDLRILDVLEAPLSVVCTCCSALERRSLALRELLAVCSAGQVLELRDRMAEDDPRDEVIAAIEALPPLLRERVRGWLADKSLPAVDGPQLARRAEP